MLRLAPWLVLSGFKLTDGPLSRSQRPPQAQTVVGAGFSHAAAGALAGFIGFQNWRMAPGPDPKGFPKPKMYLELALAMLRLAPWLVLSGFKTDGWPPVPIPKASPGPNCRWSWLLPCCGWRPGWFYRVSKLTDGPPVPIPKASPGPKCLWSWL